MINTRRIATALAIAGAVVFCGGKALAASVPAIDKCEAGIKKQTQAYEGAVIKAWTACIDAVRAQLAKNIAKPGSGDMSAAAAACEKKLDGVYNLSGTLVKWPEDSARTALNLLYNNTTGPCSDGVLNILYHVIPPTAPGVGMQFTADWLLINAESLGIKTLTQEVPDALSAIFDAQNAKGKVPTDCTGTPSPPAVFRPNLCRLAPECAEHACPLGWVLSTGWSDPLVTLSGGALQSGPLYPTVLTYDLGGTMLLNLCAFGGKTTVKQNGIYAPRGDMTGQTPANASPNVPDFLYVSGDLQNSLQPTCIGGAWTKVGDNPLGSCSGSAVACIATPRQEGWCDCTGHTLPLNTDFCQDRLPKGACVGGFSPGAPCVVASECPGSCKKALTKCYQNSDCLSIVGDSCVRKATCNLAVPDACTNSVLNATSEPYFTQPLGLITNNAGKVGDPVVAGASGAGDCYIVNTTQFTIFSGTTLGSMGADGYYCTIDDPVLPNTPAAVPMTTGVARAQLHNVVVSLGKCHSHTNGKGCGDGVNFNCCVTDADCALAGDLCDNPAPGVLLDAPAGAGPMTTDADGGFPASGHPGWGCGAYLSSDLSHLLLEGGFPAAGSDPSQSTRDSVTDFWMQCQ